MSLYTEWRNLSDNHESQESEVKFWEEYLKVEAGIYNELLNNKVEVVEGKVSELAAKYNTSAEYFMGFIDGISESLKEDITLETIEADSEIKLVIDFEKLYYNMVAVEAHWLYFLPLPHVQASFLPTLFSLTTVLEALYAFCNSFLLSSDNILFHPGKLYNQ